MTDYDAQAVADDPGVDVDHVERLTDALDLEGLPDTVRLHIGHRTGSTAS